MPASKLVGAFTSWIFQRRKSLFRINDAKLIGSLQRDHSVKGDCVACRISDSWRTGRHSVGPGAALIHFTTTIHIFTFLHGCSHVCYNIVDKLAIFIFDVQFERLACFGCQRGSKLAHGELQSWVQFYFAAFWNKISDFDCNCLTCWIWALIVLGRLHKFGLHWSFNSYYDFTVWRSSQLRRGDQLNVISIL